MLLFDDFQVLILHTCLYLALSLGRVLSAWLLTKYIPDCALVRFSCIMQELRLDHHTGPSWTCCFWM